MKTLASPASSPMLDQYDAIRATLPAGTILLLKLGDFYEVFHEEARTVAAVLQITLTSRKGVPMAGIPFHCLQAWSAKLIAAGHKVSTAEYTCPPLTP